MNKILGNAFLCLFQPTAPFCFRVWSQALPVLYPEMHQLSPYHASASALTLLIINSFTMIERGETEKSGPGGRTRKQSSMVNKFHSRQPSVRHPRATQKSCPS